MEGQSEATSEKLNLFRAMEQALRSSCRGIRLAEPVVCKITTFWGDVMKVRIPEVVSDEIALCGCYEPDLTIAFIRLLQPGMTVFDIGAHRGYFSLLAARLVGLGGQVHAFEPTPDTFSLLEENTRHLRQVRVYANAVFSRSTSLIFHDMGPGAPAFNSIYEPRLPETERQLFSKSRTERRVEAISIDDHVQATGVIPDFIKIDAESAEKAILLGARLTLQRHRPAFTLETGDAGVDGICTTRELIDVSCDCDYIPVQIAGGIFAPHTIQEQYGSGNLLFVPREKLI